MKLLTHNFLSSQFLRTVKEGYPLLLRATKVENKDFNYNEEMVSKLVPKINYPVLVQTAKGIGVNVDGLPEELPMDWRENEGFLKKIAHLTMSVDVVEGELECPESGRRFPIRQGIPNMLVGRRENRG